MPARRRALLVLPLLLAPLGAIAPPAPDSAKAPASPDANALSAFAPLAGLWRGELEGDVVEEVWMAPTATNMTGVFRWTAGDGSTRMLELMTITPGEDAPRLSVRHFNGAMTPWKSEAEGPMVCPLESRAGAVMTFKGGERALALGSITYDLSAGDKMTVTLRFTDGRGDLVIPFGRVAGDASQAAMP